MRIERVGVWGALCGARGGRSHDTRIYPLSLPLMPPRMAHVAKHSSLIIIVTIIIISSSNSSSSSSSSSKSNHLKRSLKLDAYKDGVL
ncbi:hypothetical protein E2C01_012004 [Portunus trituberculatus]|uniref:Uncharacterized protein n=1 Tax=Portunus trituberculatus TaxID=210409 RepID=A0A5B7DDC9_PORTR|nr:hypothetical protein [Portunus trituberculatus]